VGEAPRRDADVPGRRRVCTEVLARSWCVAAALRLVGVQASPAGAAASGAAVRAGGCAGAAGHMREHRRETSVIKKS
jgi:hypothetical protein